MPAQNLKGIRLGSISSGGILQFVKQMLENWRRQILACQDVERAILGLSRVESCPPLLQTQLSGALTMATKILNANVQKVIARLKAL